jgi:ATP-dependent helicase Lhr and Lhr-like helicase
MARRQFREIARVAGLVFPGYPHAGKTRAAAAGVQRPLLRRVQRYDPATCC